MNGYSEVVFLSSRGWYHNGLFGGLWCTVEVSERLVCSGRLMGHGHTSQRFFLCGRSKQFCVVNLTNHSKCLISYSLESVDWDLYNRVFFLCIRENERKKGSLCHAVLLGATLVELRCSLAKMLFTLFTYRPLRGTGAERFQFQIWKLIFNPLAFTNRRYKKKNCSVKCLVSRTRN